MSYTFAKAMGGTVGNSICELDKLDLAKSILEERNKIENEKTKEQAKIKFRKKLEKRQKNKIKATPENNNEKNHHYAW